MSEEERFGWARFGDAPEGIDLVSGVGVPVVSQNLVRLPNGVYARLNTIQRIVPYRAVEYSEYSGLARCVVVFTDGQSTEPKFPDDESAFTFADDLARRVNEATRLSVKMEDKKD